MALMMTKPQSSRFQGWLRHELDHRGLGVRTLARKIDPNNIETVRRNLNRYLAGKNQPNRPMRKAIADALGVDVDELPRDDDEEDDPLNQDLLAALKPLARFIRDHQLVA